VVAERQALADLEGGCMIPLGAWGRDIEDGVLGLDVAVYAHDGRDRVFASRTGPIEAPEALGHEVAQALREQGAEALLRRIDPANPESPSETG
jgi:hydroxymethylbilane synthase